MHNVLFGEAFAETALELSGGTRRARLEFHQFAVGNHQVEVARNGHKSAVKKLLFLLWQKRVHLLRLLVVDVSRKKHNVSVTLDFSGSATIAAGPKTLAAFFLGRTLCRKLGRQASRNLEASGSVKASTRLQRGFKPRRASLGQFRRQTVVGVQKVVGIESREGSGEGEVGGSRVGDGVFAVVEDGVGKEVVGVHTNTNMLAH